MVAELYIESEAKESNEIISILSRTGQEIKDVSRPEIDIEYVGVEPNVHINLLVRVPKFMAQYKAVLSGLGGKYSGVEKIWRLPAFLCNAIACEETFVSPFIRRGASFNMADNIDLSAGYLEWKEIGIMQFDELRIPDNLRTAWDGHDVNCHAATCKDPECPEKLTHCRKFHGLYDFQKDAVRWLVQNPYNHPGLLLSLSPGLGKTICAMIAAGILGYQRVLIIAPLSLLSVWQMEKSKWFGKSGGSDSRLGIRLRTIHGEKKIPEEGWVVTNYNTVTSDKHIGNFSEEQWDCIIIDESILIKNRESQRFQKIKNLRQSADRIWLLSGSPISKHPSDLWSQYNIIEHRGFPSFIRFRNRWCAVEETEWGDKIIGSSGRDLRRDFADIMYVKNQEEVLPDLPDMRFEHINCAIQYVPTQLRIYKQMATEFLATLESGEEIDANGKLAQLTRLQQITSNVINLSTGLAGKWQDLSIKDNVLAEMLESEDIEFPALIWTHWRPGAEALLDRVRGALSEQDVHAEIIMGDMPMEERDEMFRRFKGAPNAFTDADIDVLILSMMVGKFGLSFQKTKTVIYKDKTWFADDYVQSLMRVRRIGLTHSPRVITLHCPGTIDEWIEENLAGKAVDIANVTNADLAKMLRSLNRQLEEGLVA